MPRDARHQVEGQKPVVTLGWATFQCFQSDSRSAPTHRRPLPQHWRSTPTSQQEHRPKQP